MAPLLEDADEDFILTISDNDVDLTVSSDFDDPLKPNPTDGKRKRDPEPLHSTEHTTQKKRRKGLNSLSSSKDTKERNPAGYDIEEEEDGEQENGDKTWATKGEDDGALNSDFEFQIGDLDTGVVEDFDGWEKDNKVETRTESRKGVDIDELIARRRGKLQEDLRGGREEREISGEQEWEINGASEGDENDDLAAPDGFGMGATGSDEEMDDNGIVDSDSGMSSNEHQTSDNESIASPVPHPDDQASDISSAEGDQDLENEARRKAFFAPEDKSDNKSSTIGISAMSFQNMSLSRPILRGLASVGFSEPTPIQRKTIPIALLGKDVVGGAVTGSGKTAAFIIPILERLLYRPKKVPTSRVAILMPTRELAVQCFSVAEKLAAFTDITFCQLVGGFALREQEMVLKTRPDVIVATPGRFIDHMRNSASFTVDTLEILVLDEADRMLEDGFADELNEILNTIPKSRQTMLFSATMTDSVDKLIRVGLNRPVRLMVDPRKQTVGTLVQEFVRLRPGREDKRLGYLMQLCSKIYTDRVIIFFRQKKEAHRVRIIFGLCGFKAAELHGSMTQEQRIAAIESFRSSNVTHLLATDVASRGLDIKNVSTVLNYEAPQSHEIYLHRVGRTARAGRSGRACTIAAEPDRKVVKAAVKAGKAQGAKIVSRVVEPGLVDEWMKKIAKLEEELEDILIAEKEEKQLGQAEIHLRKGENIIDHESEIMARPKRTWFESEKEKRASKKAGRAELNGIESVAGKKKGGKLSNKDKKRLNDTKERKEGKVWKKGKAVREAPKGAKKRDKGKAKGKAMGNKIKGGKR